MSGTSYGICVTYGNGSPWGIGYSTGNVYTVPFCYMETSNGNGVFDLILPMAINDNRLKPYIYVKGSRVNFSANIALFELSVA